MRDKEKIYNQNNSADRNKTNTNVGMSSDMCIFNQPLFDIIGASKIDCRYPTNTYILSASTQNIQITFNFNGNVQSFNEYQADFKFEVYKYIEEIREFSSIAKYKSDIIPYTEINKTFESEQTIPTDKLEMDGEYLIKGFYRFPAYTDFLNKLNKTIDTTDYICGTQYGIYNDNLDFHFIAINEAEIPNFNSNPSNNLKSSNLSQNIILVNDTLKNQKIITLPDEINGDFIITLNGLTLAKELDFTVDGNILTFGSKLISGDIITITYTKGKEGYPLISDNINIKNKIISGATNEHGSNLVYYNTDTNKYEIFTSVTPLESNTIIVMINGITIAHGVDYYQSVTDKKRVILEGDILLGDIITIIYFPITNVIRGLNTNTPNISWSIVMPPQKENGFFMVEVAKDIEFKDIYYSGQTQYVLNTIHYSHDFIAKGSIGTELFYRVKNVKNYKTFCGRIITTTAYSEIIPIVIQTNEINSY